jgi:hypothetical protein
MQHVLQRVTGDPMEKRVTLGQELYLPCPSLHSRYPKKRRNPLMTLRTAKPNADGSVTVRFGGCRKDTLNCLPSPPGWNYAVRSYRPQRAILDGAWKFPEAQPVKERRGEPPPP